MIARLAKLVASRRIAVSRFFALVFFAAVVSIGNRGGLTATLITTLGLLLVTTAVVGRLWCSLYISGYKNENLITLGPYSLCRNPLYFFSLLGFVGLGFATGCASIGLVMLVVFLVAYPAVINNEERFLREHFGETFDAYCQQTPRLWPRFDRFAEPESYTVNPRLFRRTMLDVVWFVLFFVLLQGIAMLHQYGWLPTLWRLP